MNYIRIYNELIHHALEREYPDCYFEKHHIIPKSMGGTDDNIVNLTFKEHYIAHLLLAKIYGGNWMAVDAFYKKDRADGKHYIDIHRMPRWIRKRIHLTRIKINTIR